MSTATYPIGMKSWNNHLPQGGYVTWKGAGAYQNPVAHTATHIRPLTNNDVGNVFPAPFGRPRPLRHYRRGAGMPPSIVANPANSDATQINYNLHRAVRSAVTSDQIAAAIDRPDGFTQTLASADPTDCATNCIRQSFVGSWSPIKNMTEVPDPDVNNQAYCCSQTRKALKRTRPASTLVKPNYFQTTEAKLHRRCQTFKQRQFNFVTGPIDAAVRDILLKHPFVSAAILEYAKPGSALAATNLYVAQCVPGAGNAGAERAFIVAVVKALWDQGSISEATGEALIVSQTVRAFLTRLSELGMEALAANLWEIARRALGDMTWLSSAEKNCARVYYKPNNPQFAKQGAVSSATRMLKLNVDTINTAALPKYRDRATNDVVMRCDI